MLCPDCSQKQKKNQPLKGILEVELKGTVGKDYSVHDLLPVEKTYFPAIPVGNTPLWQPANLRQELGFRSLYIKDDGCNPTSSFKDRASWLVSAFAKKCKIEDIALASTGNAGSSMAGIGAAAGQKITLFLPKTAPAAKLVQALQYGATVYRVDGSYDLAYALSLAYTQKRGGLNRNTGYNPMTLEGKKTVSLELVQQLGTAPDVLFVPTGDGCILSGVYKGFKDLQQLGLIDNIPLVYAVQANTSDALYRAAVTGKFESMPARTVADSISVNVPSNGFYALKQLKKYSGKVITVSDEMIIASQARLSRQTGLFTEPAGATAFAGFLKIRSELDPGATIVLLATGNGLKDSQTASKGIVVPQRTIRAINQI